MMRLPSLGCRAALVTLLTPLLFAQNTPSPSPTTAGDTTQNQDQADTVVSADKLQYFVLEHRSPEQIQPEDAALLKKRKRDLLAEGEFYGYDMSAKGWSYEQSVCPFMPDFILLRYSSKDAAGADSIFTALMPKSGGRIRIVPVLNHGATRFKPAAVDPRNYQLFGQVIPAELAAQNSGPDGKWLSLSMCYAEMTGEKPQVPNTPSLDIHMIKAPPPTLRITVAAKEHEVRFAEPISPTEYRLWNINYSGAGQITSVSDDVHSFGEPVVRTVPEPTPKLIPNPPPPVVKEIPSSQQATPIPQPKPEQPQ
ncbi:hypothetical protein H7849_08365 [Alloacidobacterium dinghuense]|uniref:Uncharacterized protein n=1 Tax=Alloacidobacterium dinghuense TaxID=2763107 RepID=A0A7G8BMY6_9BACT|nr:hypothetical protein [Alloacidobacterium dinghuense]QNI33906.1 hypothetical protein H7849_08365 [Alloacidobacterium dinghuense]